MMTTKMTAAKVASPKMSATPKVTAASMSATAMCPNVVAGYDTNQHDDETGNRILFHGTLHPEIAEFIKI
jgi:hypothetical protein